MCFHVFLIKIVVYIKDCPLKSGMHLFQNTEISPVSGDSFDSQTMFFFSLSHMPIAADLLVNMAFNKSLNSMRIVLS